MIKRLLIGIVICFLGFKAFAVTDSNPCLAPNALLNIAHRGNVADSPCVVPDKNLMWESGYQYQKIRTPASAQVYPLPAITFGLPANSDVAIFLPTYVHQTVFPNSGYTASFIDLKHVFFYNEKWILTMTALIYPPGGSASFGTADWGGGVNGIASYNFTEKINFTLTLSGTTSAEPRLFGGRRFSSVNPDFVLSYAPNDKTNIFAEIYGQTKTGADDGDGYNSEYGLLYLIRENILFDMEVGHRVSGSLNNIEYYIGGGFTFLLK